MSESLELPMNDAQKFAEGTLWNPERQAEHEERFPVQPTPEPGPGVSDVEKFQYETQKARERMLNEPTTPGGADGPYPNTGPHPTGTTTFLPVQPEREAWEERMFLDSHLTVCLPAVREVVSIALASQSADVKLCAELVAILSAYCGETGANEGAVDTLKRKLSELATQSAELSTLKRELEEAKSTIRDYQDAWKAALTPQYGDEQHCSCVPALKLHIADLSGKLATLRHELQDAIGFNQGMSGELEARADDIRTLTSDRDALREAAREFVDRCDSGEIRSRYTYTKFKALLE